MLNIAAIVVLIICVCLYAYFKWSFSYWKRNGVVSMEPSIPFGTAENPFARREFIGHRIQKYYNQFKGKGCKHVGLYFFTSPTYLPIDLDYIRNIMSQDFRYFTDRGGYTNEKSDPLSAHLFNLEGERWAKLRKKLTPTFTSGKMRLMFPTMVQCGEQLARAVEGSAPIEAKNVSSCFTTNVIGACAFGVDCNSFENPNNEFRRYGERVFRVLQTQTLKSTIAMAKPELARWLNISLTPNRITDFFIGLVRDTVAHRENSATDRKDFMQILIDMKNSANEEGSLSIEEMAANTYIFFLAGFETSSTTMSFCLYELARNLSIQEKLRREILDSLDKHQGITYEAVMEMKYLDQVLKETLRKYPPGSLIPRVCVEDYRIPSTDSTIPKGTRLYIPVYALHHDPDYYPNPDEFDPTRFSEENSPRRHPYAYLPFGEGPRICIGVRFGVMQAKIGLVALLRKFSFRLNGKTKTPLEIDPNNLIISAKNGIWLDVYKN